MHHEKRAREPTPPRTPTADAAAMDEDRLMEAVQLVLMRMAFSKDRENLLTALSAMNPREEPKGQSKQTSTTEQTGLSYTDVEGYELPVGKRESKAYEHLNKDTMESPNVVC